ncbi:MAG: SDR family oxidoreductase [Burkholderiales bacterium]|nr:SDR family oxidoreductase [Burkholderiales bacterium]
MKNAVVTGAGSGIGRACAQALLKQGWQVALLGRRAEALQETAAGFGAAAWVQPCDVSNEVQVQAAFAALRERWGRLDLLFNNAGGGLGARLPDEVSGSEWRAVVDVNLNGAFYCLREAFALMRAQRPQGGRIINNGSLAAYVPRPQTIAYAATKSAISGLTRAAALDGRVYSIAVGQLDIGNAATPLTIGLANGPGALQPDGTRRPEPQLDLDSVAQTFLAMAELPLSANVLFSTVMATQMPFVGRG